MSQDLIAILTSPRYYVPVFLALAAYLGLWLIKNVIVKRLQRLSVTTDTFIDDIVLESLDKTKQFFMVGTALFIGFQASPFDTKKDGPLADKVFLILLAVQIVIWGNQAITSWFQFSLKKRNNDPAVKTTFGFMGLLLKVGFVIGVALFVLNNLGVNVTTFITGLGVGGIAIALATQNILGDLFSSLSIVMDKPFIVGDYINLGEWQGTVEHVGLKTTRIRSLTGEQIIVSNSDLLSSKIRNHKRMSERRVAFVLGLTYQSSKEKLKLVPKLVEEIVRKEEPVARFERAHFMRFGASSLDFEVVYWVTTPEHMIHMDMQQRILFAIQETFENNGLDFAYPTQTVIVARQD